MPYRFLIGGVILLTLLQFPTAGAVSAQERNQDRVDHDQTSPAQSSVPELAPLPTSLTTEQIRALQSLGPVSSPLRSSVRRNRPGFYRGAFNRPLTPREVGLREIVYGLAANRRQFVHVRLADGHVVTGTITFADASAFQVQTDIFGGCHSIRYRELAEPPRAVLAVGTRTVRGLETTGLVVLCVVAIPLALVVYPLIAAGVLKD